VSYWQALLLGLVQGLTEFLPVSSDGHLVLVGHLAGVRTPGVFVEVALHLATLGSILVAYGGKFFQLVGDVWRRRPEALSYAGLMVIAMIPAGLVGVFLEDLVGRAFDSLWAAGVGFLVTGVALWSTRRRVEGPRSRPTLPGAVLIGVGQALAILPGISRSGMTVSAALWNRLDPVRAADFSFLMAIPLIAGAGLLEARHLRGNLGVVGVGPLVAACIVAFLAGIWAIRLLVRLLARRRFHAFAPYCFAVGVLTLLLAAWRS
jgi:undecaprenyl-diphosphatase